MMIYIVLAGGEDVQLDPLAADNWTELYYTSIIIFLTLLFLFLYFLWSLFNNQFPKIWKLLVYWIG